MPAGVLKHYVVPAVALLINISMYAAPLKAVVRANREQRLGGRQQQSAARPDLGLSLKRLCPNPTAADFNPLPPLLTFVNSTSQCSCAHTGAACACARRRSAPLRPPHHAARAGCLTAAAAAPPRSLACVRDRGARPVGVRC